MGRGNFEAALASVRAFEDAEVEEAERDRSRESKKRKGEDEDDRRRSSKKTKKSSKEKDKKHRSSKKSHGDEKRDKERKRKKDKKGKHSKSSSRKKSSRKASLSDSSDEGSSGSSSDDESGDGGARGDPARWNARTQLERGQAAVKATRDLMARHPGIQAELRELFRKLDSGEGVDISGVQEADLRERLDLLFSNLPLSRVKGAYKKIPGGDSLLGGVLGTVLQESVMPITEAEAIPAGETPPVTDCKEDQSEAATQAQPKQAPVMAASADDDEWVVEEADPDGEPDKEGRQHGAEGSAGADEEAEAAGPIGPAMPPPGVIGKPDVQEDDSGEEAGGSPGPQPAVGPAMPSREMLDAAARAAEERGWEEEEEEGWDDLIGPVPPEIMLDIEAAGEDARSQEVARIIKAIAEAESAAAAAGILPSATSAAPKPPDAYQVLGVERSAAKSDVKKRYWKLSLLIHPDKCDHPRAKDAFAALNVAAKTLQDEAGRKQLDERLDDEQLMRMAVEEAKEMQRKAEWEAVRAGRSASSVHVAPAGPQSRESWMTELPPEREVKAGISLDSMVTTFNQKGNQGRGDTSAWTDTPSSRAERARLGPAGPLMLPSARDAAEGRRQEQVAGLVDSYNSNTRAKSLLEQHLERQEREKKEKKQKKREEKAREKELKGKKKKKGDGSGDVSEAKAGEDGEEWVGNHPWRPFDREKDLGPTLKAKSAEEMLKSAGSLSNRFGASGGRSFL